MSASLQFSIKPKRAHPTTPSLRPARSMRLQRACACGGSAESEECEECKETPTPRASLADERFGHSLSHIRIHAGAQADDPEPQHKGFLPDDLSSADAADGEESEDTAPQKAELPHAGAATIACEGGAYVVKLNDWAGEDCGIPDCVTVHEHSHLDDWKTRWPNGCKKDDGTNQAEGYLPTGGDGYAEFLKTSECTAHTKDLACAATKRAAAKGRCKRKWKQYIKDTEDEKKKFC
jgi:hypothetical protein